MPSTPLAKMTRISSIPSALIQSLVIAFVIFIVAVFAVLTLIVILDYGIFQGATKYSLG